jgi:hypothetical protein
MLIVHSLFDLTTLRSVYRTFGLALLVFFAAVCWLAIRYFEQMPTGESLAEYANGFALGTGTLLTLVIAQQHPLRAPARPFWWAVALGFAVVAANEVFNIFDRAERAWGDDDYSDLIILCLTPIGLYLACILESAPRLAVTAMKFGFLFQCISDLIDLCDGDGYLYLYQVPVIDRALMDVVTDISELIFIETYLFGLGCLLLHIVIRRLRLQGEAP